MASFASLVGAAVSGPCAKIFNFYHATWFWRFAAEDSGSAHLEEEMKRLNDAGLGTISRTVHDRGTTRAFRFVSVTLTLVSGVYASRFREIIQDLAKWRKTLMPDPVITLKLQPGELPDTFSARAIFKTIPDRYRMARSGAGWTNARMYLKRAVPGLPPSTDVRIEDLDAVICTLVALPPRLVRLVPPTLLIEGCPTEAFDVQHSACVLFTVPTHGMSNTA
jgi:hypothetical protein